MRESFHEFLVRVGSCGRVNAPLATANPPHCLQGWASPQPWMFYVGFGDSHRCGGAVGEFCEKYGVDAQV